MRSVRFDLRVVMAALAIGIMAIAAQPVRAEVTEVFIISPTEAVPFEGSAPSSVEVTFDFSTGILPPANVVGYLATITIGPLNLPVAEEIFVYSTADLPGPFMETLSIPAGTSPGCYDLGVEVEELRGESLETADPCCGAFADEAAAVCIVESMPGEPSLVPMDIKPGSCPNPFNMGKRGVIPVAIVGTADLPVSEIDPHSIELMGVKPLRFNYEDVATPYFPDSNEPDCMDCTDARGDGHMDLTLKFDAQDLAEAIRERFKVTELEDRSCLILTLTGVLGEGDGATSFFGEDVVRIQQNGPGKKGSSDKGKKKKSESTKKSGKEKSEKAKSGKEKAGRK